MCNDCKEHPKSDCFQVESSQCDTGCKDVISTGCVYHNINNNERASRLPFIGVTKGASLNYILKKIDDAIGAASVNTNFSGFNLHNFTTEKVTNIKEFVSATTEKIVDLDKKYEELKESDTDFEKSLEKLNQEYSALFNPQVSSSKLNINTTDTLDVVVDKIINYVEDISVQGLSKNYSESNSVSFTESNTSVSADVKLNPDTNNQLKETEEGLYVGPINVSETLKKIQDNPELLKVFTALVKEATPCYKFDVMSQRNDIIKYVSCLGTEVKVNVTENVLKQLTDVRTMQSIPSSQLTITFKGI